MISKREIKVKRAECWKLEKTRVFKSRLVLSLRPDKSQSKVKQNQRKS